MGKLNEDMKFLDQLASHPALKHNIFATEQKQRDIDIDQKILTTIQGYQNTNI